ncbi:MAG: hypothetical protein KAI24_10450 [Planctomycetes bacterium]|nr:hypothetical protein [Planctomycetota bacterium]
MSIARVLPLALVLASTAFAQDQEKPKHLLRYNFKAGTVVNQIVSQDMTMTMNMGAEDMVTKMTMNMFQTTTLKSVEGDTAQLEQHITRVKAVMDNPMMSMDYDSADEDSDPGMLEGLADLVDQKTSMKLTDRGKLSDIKMPEGMNEAGGVDIKQMMSQSVTQMPDEPVAIGDTWTVDQKMPLGQMGDAQTKVTYKLIAVTDKQIVLEQKLDMDLSEMEMPGGMEVKDVKAGGKIIINRLTGLPMSMTMDMKMDMTGQMNMKMNMQMSIKPAPEKPAKKDGDKGDAKTGEAKKEGGK